ncbi:MAG: SLBB domain-containing protein [Planctomycetota bacterium]|nr:SLBB domain-containing protein [Planctomycetota bacterium]
MTPEWKTLRAFWALTIAAAAVSGAADLAGGGRESGTADGVEAKPPGGARDPGREQFRFAGGERIRIFVPQTVGESFEQIVTSDGIVMLPTGGTVRILGKTLVEAQEALKERLEKESGARRVYVALVLLDVPPGKVYVGGEVKQPQALSFSRGMPPTLAAALAAAGGPTGDADLSKVSVVRTRADGTRTVISVDASGISRPDNPDVGPELEPNDVVLVPRGDVFILAGEVSRPGAFNRRDLFLDPNEPARLSRVIFAGGGLRPSANRSDIRIIRSRQDGTREIIRANLEASLGPGPSPAASAPGSAAGPAAGISSGPSDKPSAGSPVGPAPGAVAPSPAADADPVLRNGDIVMVGGSGGVTVLGRVRAPGVFPLAGDTLKLSRAIAMAGGFAEFAKTSSVIVIRASAPRQPVRIDVNEITKEGNLNKDLDLGDGDIVFVGERLL